MLPAKEHELRPLLGLGTTGGVYRDENKGRWIDWSRHLVADAEGDRLVREMLEQTVGEKGDYSVTGGKSCREYSSKQFDRAREVLEKRTRDWAEDLRRRGIIP